VGPHFDFESDEGPPDRLGLALSSEPLFSPRVRALLAAGVLALSFGAATVSVASETDSEQEGLSPQPSAPSDQVGDGSGEETPLPVEVIPLPAEGPGEPDAEPPDADLVDGPPAGAPQEDVAPTVPPEAEPAPISAPAPPISSPPVVPATPPATPVAPVAPAPGDAVRVVVHAVEEHGANRQTPHLRVNGRNQGRRIGGDPQTAHSPEAAQAPQPPAVASHTQSASRSVGLRPGQRFYVVRSGDSLWSIAAALRGPDSSSGTVAREVRRLWRLNRERIGTGNPDLLPAGVRLRLAR